MIFINIGLTNFQVKEMRDIIEESDEKLQKIFNKLFMKKITVLVSVFVLLLSVLPVQAADTQAPDISVVAPLSAIVNIPTIFYVTASDPSGVVSCEMVISSKSAGSMAFNTLFNRWEFTHTFNESRTANSIRARCADGVGNEVLGPARVMSVLEIDVSLDGGEGEEVTPLPREVDATGFEPEEIIDISPVLIKTVCPGGEDINHPCRAVYFLDNNGKRHAFPNEKVYFTWYIDFINIHLVTDGTMASFPLGGNVRYHPASKMVKFRTSATVYVVGRYGELRPIASEVVAQALYGENWNQQIDDISDTFFSDYNFGDAIESAADYSVNSIRDSVVSINDNL